MDMGHVRSCCACSGIIVWTGSPFIIVIYMFAVLLAIVYGFIKSDKMVLFFGPLCFP